MTSAMSVVSATDHGSKKCFEFVIRSVCFGGMKGVGFYHISQEVCQLSKKKLALNRFSVIV